jgi:transposase
MDLLLSLLPREGLLALQAVEIEPENQQITVRLKSEQETTNCPMCNETSQRQHSRYVRTLQDLPWADFSVVIRLEVGKWFCQNPACERRIFTERLPGVVAPWARQTQRLAEVQAELGLTVGGRAGACLSELLHSLTSRDTLIRLIRRQPLAEYATPRVLGIDDWAIRRGQTYGTILVDLETHQVVDVLPDRSAEGVERWLKAHPHVEIVSRDRAGEYAAGASAGAPDALQVADRWHLMKNLGDALTEALKRHSRELRAISLAPAATSEEAEVKIEGLIETPNPPGVPGTTRQIISQQKRARRLALYRRVRELDEQGWMQKAIAAEVNLSPKTVSRWLAARAFPERQPRSSAPRLIDSYKPYLLQRWQEGCRNGAQLRREIEAKGYRGGATVVADFIAQLRREQGLLAAATCLPQGLIHSSPF